MWSFSHVGPCKTALYYRSPSDGTVSHLKEFCSRVQFWLENSWGGHKAWRAVVTHPCGDHAQSCLTWFSRSRALALHHRLHSVGNGERVWVRTIMILVEHGYSLWFCVRFWLQKQFGKWMWVQMVSDTSGAWIQPVTLCVHLCLQEQSGKWVLVQMVSDTGGAWIQPVTLCTLSVGPDDQWYWWSMDTYCDSVYTSKKQFGKWVWVQMVSDIGGAWIQPVTLCPLASAGTVWEVSVDPDDQWYWWSMDTTWSLPVTLCPLVSTGTVWEVSVDPDDQWYWWSMDTTWSLPVTLCTLVSTGTVWEVSVGPDGQWYWWGLDTACDFVYT